MKSIMVVANLMTDNDAFKRGREKGVFLDRDGDPYHGMVSNEITLFLF